MVGLVLHRHAEKYGLVKQVTDKIISKVTEVGTTSFKHYIKILQKLDAAVGHLKLVSLFKNVNVINANFGLIVFSQLQKREYNLIRLI